MAPLSGLAAAGTWLVSHLPGLQVRGAGARPSRDRAAWLPLIFWRLPAVSQNYKQPGWPVLRGPQDGSLALPTPTCPAWASARVPSCQVPRTGQSRREAGGTLWATGRRDNNVKPGHPGLGPKMGQGWRGSSRTLGWAESGRRKKAQSLHAAFS